MMSRGAAIALGGLTVWPILYMAIFMCGMFVMVFAQMGTGGHSKEPPGFFFVFFLLHLITMLEVFALLAFYIVHVFKTDRIRQDTKALWAVVLFFGNALAMPVYWYLYIWRELTPVSVNLPKESAT